MHLVVAKSPLHQLKLCNRRMPWRKNVHTSTRSGQSSLAPRVVKNAWKWETFGCICASAEYAVMWVAATIRRISMPPNTSTRLDTRSSSRSSLERSGVTATWMRSSSRLCEGSLSFTIRFRKLKVFRKWSLPAPQQGLALRFRRPQTQSQICVAHNRTGTLLVIQLTAG